MKKIFLFLFVCSLLLVPQLSHAADFELLTSNEQGDFYYDRDSISFVKDGNSADLVKVSIRLDLKQSALGANASADMLKMLKLGYTTMDCIFDRANKQFKITTINIWANGTKMASQPGPGNWTAIKPGTPHEVWLNTFDRYIDEHQEIVNSR